MNLEPDASDERPVIVAFGDSLTAGLGVEPGNSYPDFLQAELDRLGYPYRVINEGISGDTTDMALVRIEEVMARSPQFVVVAFGGNDGLRGLATDGMQQNLRQIISRLKESGVEVILAGMKLPPNYGREYTAAFERAFTQLAEEMEVPFVPFLMEGVALNPNLMQEDGIHPNAEGHRRMARNVLEVLEPRLAPARQR